MEYEKNIFLGEFNKFVDKDDPEANFYTPAYVTKIPNALVEKALSLISSSDIVGHMLELNICRVYGTLFRIQDSEYYSLLGEVFASKKNKLSENPYSTQAVVYKVTHDDSDDDHVFASLKDARAYASILRELKESPCPVDIVKIVLCGKLTDKETE